jgi:hypothetical protein
LPLLPFLVGVGAGTAFGMGAGYALGSSAPDFLSGAGNAANPVVPVGGVAFGAGGAFLFYKPEPRFPDTIPGPSQPPEFPFPPTLEGPWWGQAALGVR